MTMNLFRKTNVLNLRDGVWAEVFSGLEARAEKDLDTKSTFVDPRGILQDVRGKTNTQLMGRRGTGKTSILLKLYQENFVAFKKGLMYKGRQEFLPIYISVGALQKIAPFEQQNNSTEVSQDPELKATNNYRRFLSALLTGTQTDMPGLRHYVENLKMGPITKRRALKRLEELELYLRQGEDQIQSVEREYSETKKRAAGINAKASAKLTPIEQSGGAEFGGLLRAIVEQSQGGKVLAKAKLVLSEVSVKLLELVKALRCKRLLILVDEWSSGQNPVASQPFFLELLKHSFISQPSIFIKMAVVPENYKEYDNPSQTGLEQGGAYFSPMDLDDLRPYGNNYSKVADIMTEILNAHLVARLKQYVRRLPNKLGDNIPKDFLFANEECLRDIVYASEGNIRDFILICAKVYSNFRKGKSDIKLERSTVRQGISEYFKLKKWGTQNDEIKKSFLNICHQIHDNKQNREIRIRDTTNTDVLDVLANLRETRLIHNSRDPLMIGGKWYKFFIVDYSGYLFIQSEYPHEFPSTSIDSTPNLTAHPDKVFEISTDHLL